MTLQLGALRDALLDAGVSPEKANQAADEFISLLGTVWFEYENRFASIEMRLILLTWAAAINVVVSMAIIAKLIMA
jgi:hypothetical protein